MGAGEHVQPAALGPAVPIPRWRRRGSGLALTAIDEALLSALSLGLAFVLIRGGTKAEYGVFALVNGVIILLRGAQNSLVLTPLATIGGRLRGDERAAFARAMSRLQTGAGLFAALAITVGVAAFAGVGGSSLAVGSGLALMGSWLREFRRCMAILEGRNGAALAGDALFVVLAVGSVLALLTLTGHVSAGAMLSVTGIAAATAGLLGFPRAAPTIRGCHREAARLSLDQARWSLPGTAVSWGQACGYVYAVGLLLDSAAVGEVAAARLFVTPLLLVGVAWNRMSVPRAAAMLAEGRSSLLLVRYTRALRLALAGSALYFAVLAVAFILGLERVLPSDYAGCEIHVLAWTAFAAVSLVGSISTGALIARLEFRALFVMNVASASAGLILVVALIGPLGSVGAVVGLTGGELLMGALGWRMLLGERSQ